MHPRITLLTFRPDSPKRTTQGEQGDGMWGNIALTIGHGYFRGLHDGNCVLGQCAFLWVEISRCPDLYRDLGVTSSDGVHRRSYSASPDIRGVYPGWDEGA